MILKLILGCWYLFALFWFITMFFTKRTLTRESGRRRLRYWLLYFLAFWLLFAGTFRQGKQAFGILLLPHSVALDRMALAITVLGLAFAIWARATLGANWSGSITFKENHELIQRGPYALVRHPIYTAMLLMAIGTALAVGTAGALLSIPILFLSFWIKYRQEEALMLEHFGDAYRAYMTRVKAIIPFVA
jgi:protein-S-isoprenylcysteine O-methyltransferase Ste14